MNVYQIIGYTLAVLGAAATFAIVLYLLSPAIMRGWLHEIEKFLTNKYENNEQTKKE